MPIKKTTIASLKGTWVTFAQSARGRLVLRVVRGVLLIGIVTFLAYQLTRVGWADIARSLPTNPWFYVFFLLLYFSLPFTEMLIYWVSWRHEHRAESFLVFLKKRVYNREVLGYSGEVYFFTWARERLQLKDLDILKTIRDNNILSSVASTVIAVGLLFLFLYSGHLRVTDWIERQHAAYLIGGSVFVGILGLLIWRYRRFVFSMPWRTAGIILGLYGGRALLGQILQISMWSVAIPEVSLRVWFTFAAVSLLLSRLPVLPNQGLIFLGASVELSNLTDISSAAVAGMLLVAEALDKVFNLVLFTLLSLLQRNRDRQLTAPAEEMKPSEEKVETETALASLNP